MWVLWSAFSVRDKTWMWVHKNILRGIYFSFNVWITDFSHRYTGWLYPLSCSKIFSMLSGHKSEQTLQYYQHIFSPLFIQQKVWPGTSKFAKCLVVCMKKHYSLNETNRWSTLQSFIWKYVTFFLGGLHQHERKEENNTWEV